jgi:uncharacterized membrane protein YphA (DoxX/SURF4 family)
MKRALLLAGLLAVLSYVGLANVSGRRVFYAGALLFALLLMLALQERSLKGTKRALLLAGRLILAGIFLLAGAAKLREPWPTFAASLFSFKLLPISALEPVAKTLPWCEVALGIAIFSGLALRWFALIGSLVIATFLTVLTRSYALGLAVDCGCFGSGETLGPMTLVRDSSMLALALAVMIGAFRMSRGPRRNVPVPDRVE